MGWYAETHLLKVVEAGYKASIGPNSSSLEDFSTLLLLIKKEKATYGENRPVFVDDNKSIQVKYSIIDLNREKDSIPFLKSIEFHPPISTLTSTAYCIFEKSKDANILCKRISDRPENTHLANLGVFCYEFTHYIQQFQKSCRQNVKKEITFCQQLLDYEGMKRARTYVFLGTSEELAQVNSELEKDLERLESMMKDYGWFPQEVPSKNRYSLQSEETKYSLKAFLPEGFSLDLAFRHLMRNKT